MFQREFEVGAQQVQAFADLVQDHNPVHLDPEFAATTRYKQPICHGLLCASFISGCLVEAFGQGTIYLDQQLTFQRPVPVGSKLRVVLGEPQIEGDRLRVPTKVEVLTRNLWKKAIEGSALILAGQPAADQGTNP